MKEEKKVKKTTTKKSTTKKTDSKKSSSVKTKTNKTPIKKEEVNVIKEEVKKEESSNNKDLLLRAVLVIAYTLIIVILVIGFIEPYLNGLKVTSNYKPAYLVQEEILSNDHILALENAKNKLGALNGDYFVYVGYTKMYNSDIQVLDMGIANLIDKYNLKDKFYYINIDSIINKKNKVDIVNRLLGYQDVLIKKVPTILYVNSDNIIRTENIITRDDDKLITVGDFQKLLDINQFVVRK